MEETNYREERLYLKAQKRVKEIKSFYIHLTVYLLIIPLIIFINLRFSPSYHWFWYSVLGWGVGLFFHWFGVIGFEKIGFGKNWEDKKIKQFIDEEESRSKRYKK